MPRYVSVAQHAITPDEHGTVAPLDEVELELEDAQPYLDARQLVPAPEPIEPKPEPIEEPKQTARSASAKPKETDQ